jgi:hypothetical protein
MVISVVTHPVNAYALESTLHQKVVLLHTLHSYNSITVGKRGQVLGESELDCSSIITEFM